MYVCGEKLYKNETGDGEKHVRKPRSSKVKSICSGKSVEEERENPKPWEFAEKISGNLQRKSGNLEIYKERGRETDEKGMERETHEKRREKLILFCRWCFIVGKSKGREEADKRAPTSVWGLTFIGHHHVHLSHSAHDIWRDPDRQETYDCVHHVKHLEKKPPAGEISESSGESEAEEGPRDYVNINGYSPHF
ncbi:hypothetical protein ACLOJK_024531 [Asimina triloba]